MSGDRSDNGTDTSRRNFLRVGGAAVGALIIGIPGTAMASLRRLDVSDADRELAEGLSHQYLRIDTTGVVTIVVARSEMGQGVRTALPMILADELGADWTTIRLLQASPSATFPNLSTGGSESVSSMWEPLRRAGAAAREMLCTAAGSKLAVDRSTLHVANGRVTHEASGRSLSFAELVADAARVPVPQQLIFRDPEHYTIVGKRTRRTDGQAIVKGTATYGLDVRLPGMKFAVMAMPAVPGATIVRFNAAAARAVAGVRDVIELPTGIAVVADSTWAALKGRTALAVVWNDGKHATFDSAALRLTLRDRSQRAGEMVARSVGDADATIAAALIAKRIESTYEFPFQSHATMEPQNCTAHVTAESCQVWIGTQEPVDVQRSVAKQLGRTDEQVTVNIPLMGGGFGRRLVSEYASDAAELSKRVAAPVQLVWSREDDFAHDWYQPMSVSKLSASVGANKLPTAWRHRVVAPAVTASFGGKVVMEAEALGARDVPYTMPNVRVEYTHVPTPHNMGWWRAIQFVPNIFARECFVDELAVSAGINPLEYRLMMLDEHSQQDLKRPKGPNTPPQFDVDRLRRVLHEVAKKSRWEYSLPKGVGRGLACMSYDDRSYVAQVAEVDTRGGRLRVRRVVTALDIGLVVNPLGAEAQVESGVLWALTAVLRGEMRFARGRASRTSFAQYRLASLTDTPVIETHFMPADSSPSGAGEPPVPAVAPAIVNAIFNATGKRVRSLPIDPAIFTG